MALSLWISPALQYGVPARGEARQGASRQIVAQAIKRHLFLEKEAEQSSEKEAEQSSEKEAEQSSEKSHYQKSLDKFTAKLTPDLKTKNQMLISLWQALLSEDESEENLFCLTLHVLCAVLAQQWVDQDANTDDEDENDEIDDNVADPAANAVERFQVVSALTHPLRQHMWKRLRKSPEDQYPDNESWYAVAHILVNILLESLDNWFELKTGDTRQQDGKAHTPKTITICQPELTDRLNKLLKGLPLSFTAQPLKEPVAYHFDNAPPENDTADTCIQINLIRYGQSNEFLRDTHRQLLWQDHRPPKFQRYLDAINVQQAVPWRINRALLDQVRCLNKVVEVESSTDENAELIAWVKAHLYRPKNERPKTFLSKKNNDRSARAAEFLDNPLAKLALDELCPADSDDSHTFYLPWKADYRGRIFAETPWFMPQGADLQRALLEFANGQVLTENGANALRRHGANLVKRKRLLDDLAIANRQVVTLEERERWINEHETDILASAASPLTATFWREVADKPMQFLAFCLAYQQWRSHPDLPVHFPVQIDGTCNGLQHIAALTGDVALAESVNVLPRENGLPADIYSELVEVARGQLDKLTDSKSLGIKLAHKWLAANPARRNWLDRKTAKKVVMTIPYGASENAQARGVLEALEKTILEDWQHDSPSSSELDALVEWNNKDRNKKWFVFDCSRDLFKAKRQLAFAANDELTQTLAKAEWERLCIFASYVALVLVKHLRTALNKRYPKVKAFSGWLKKSADACAGSGKDVKDEDGNDVKDVGLPLLWLTPLDFPVIQPGFQIKDSNGAEPRLGTQKFRVDFKVMQKELDPNKQGNALLPNLIHSLDATHLAMTLLAAQQHGVSDVGSIHDCLLCHPNAADDLSKIVRTTFAELYAPDEPTGRSQPLAAWYKWMQEVVALRTLPEPGKLEAALKWPNGAGERDLKNDAEFGQADAKTAYEWLAWVRQQPSTQRFLLQALLARAKELLTPNEAPELPKPPVTAALPFAQRQISRYFFS
jgi:DNA-directed RNA polymerase